MRIAGKDYIFKILNQQYFESVFEKRKKYFTSGVPQWLGKNSTLFFAMKNIERHDYDVVGEAKPTFAGRLVVSSGDESKFSEEHNWPFVIELTNLQKYSKPIPATLIFPTETVSKLHAQRPYGIELSPGEGRSAKDKIAQLLI